MYPKGISSAGHILRKPLAKCRLPALAPEVDERFPALFAHYRIAVSPDCSNWNDASQDLTSALIDEFEPWLRQADTCGWQLLVCLLRRLDAFKGEAEIVSPGKPVFKHRETELLGVKKIADEWGLSLDAFDRLMRGMSQPNISKEAQEVFEQFRREIVKHRTPDYEDVFKAARARYREEPDLVEQEFAHTYGFLGRNIEQCLLALNEDGERKKAIARRAAELFEGRVNQASRKSSAERTPSLRTAIVNYEWAKGKKYYNSQHPYLPRLSEAENALTDEEIKVLDQKRRILLKYL